MSSRIFFNPYFFITVGSATSFGAVGWVARQTSTGTDAAYGVTVDSSGNVYICGEYGAALTAWNANRTSFGTTLAIGTADDCFLIKYDTNGNVVWVARQTSTGNNDAAAGVATDSSGNVYICGRYSAALTAWNANQTSFGTTLAITTTSDSFLIKYDTNGNVVWVARQTSTATDLANGVTVDSSGNVYICGEYGATLTAWNANGTSFGTTLAITTTSDSFLIKYDTNGNVVWVARQTSTGANDAANGVDTDSSGNVYICGRYSAALTAWNANQTAFGTTLAGGFDSFLIKYDTNGNVVWVTRQTSTATDLAYGVTVDSSGNVYICGLYTAALTAWNANGTSFGTTLAIGTADDSFLIKYDTNGNVVWVARQTGTGANERAFGVTVDSSGNVYICGIYQSSLTVWNANQTSFGTTLAVVGASDCFLIKYDTNGNVLWVARQTSTGTNDQAYGVATDSSGNVYICGLYGAALTAWNANQTSFGTTLAGVGGGDSFLVKYGTNPLPPYTAQGIVQWVTRQTSTANDLAYGVTVDSSGNVYIGGEYGAALTAWNANQTSFGTTLAIVTDSDSFLIKYDTNGNVLWVTRQTSTGNNERAMGVTVDSSGNVYICGAYQSSLTAWNANGTAFGTTLAVVGASDSFLIKYDTNGNVLWVSRQTSSVFSNGVDTDSSGNVYICGRYREELTAWNANGTSFGTTLALVTQDCFLIKYDTNGNVLWVTRQTSLVTTDQALGVTVDSSGNVYICGEYGAALTAWNANGTAFGTTLAIVTETDSFLIKYDTNGNVLWVTRQTSTGNNDQANGVTVDSSGNVYICGTYIATLTAWNANQTSFGTTLAIVTTSDCFLIKYDTNGNVVWVARQTGTGNNDQALGVTVDSSGNVYICGLYIATLTAWNANQTSFGTTLALVTTSDCFLIKYDTNGNVVWVARQTGAGGNDQAYGVTVDSSGNVYICGRYSAALTAWNANQTSFGTTLALAGGSDSFLVKYS